MVCHGFGVILLDFVLGTTQNHWTGSSTARYWRERLLPKKFMIRSAGQQLAGEGVRRGDKNQEGVCCSQCSLLYSFLHLFIAAFLAKTKVLRRLLRGWWSSWEFFPQICPAAEGELGRKPKNACEVANWRWKGHCWPGRAQAGSLASKRDDVWRDEEMLMLWGFWGWGKFPMDRQGVPRWEHRWGKPSLQQCLRCVEAEGAFIY